jgi:hypothetical protein
MPIINWISLLHHDGETETDLLRVARERMDIVGKMELSVNGSSLTSELRQFRVRSPFFNVQLPEDNIVGLLPGTRRAISDGYWVFIKPLDDYITLDSLGSCSSGATKIGVHYQIISV